VEFPKKHRDLGDLTFRGLALEEFSVDLTKAARLNRLDPLIGREPEIERITHILCRRAKNNPILIGEPGVGKTALVEGLAQRIAANEVPRFLYGKRILALDLSLVVAGTKYRGQFEERLNEIVREAARNPEIIMFIDEVHTVVGAGGSEGALDAANILKPALARSQIQCIGATTPAEFRKKFEKNRSLERRFQPIWVSPSTEEESLRILDGVKHRFETFHRVRYSPEGLETAVIQSQRYITERSLPDKAIDVMDEAGARVKLRYHDHSSRSHNDWEPEVTSDDVEEVISSWTGIPMTSLKGDEAYKLQHIAETLGKRVIGQDAAVSAVARAIRRARTGFKNVNRPVGSFLFVGPTGVGKTEVARTLAEFLFGSERALIRCDMSEYMEKHSVSKMIGSPPGYVGHEEGGQLTDRIKRNPYSILLLDEIEKAHPDVCNLLLQVLDAGSLTDSIGNNIDFKNVIIIMTSNVGGRSLQKGGGPGFHASLHAEELAVHDEVMRSVKQTFNPEFINRLDEIVIFNSLSDQCLFDIAGILVDELNSTLVRRNLQVHLTAEGREWLVNSSCADRSYGARPLRRSLQIHIEDPLSDAIIAGGIPEASLIEFYVEAGLLRHRVLQPEELTESTKSADDLLLIS